MKPLQAAATGTGGAGLRRWSLASRRPGTVGGGWREAAWAPRRSRGRRRGAAGRCVEMCRHAIEAGHEAVRRMPEFHPNGRVSERAWTDVRRRRRREARRVLSEQRVRQWRVPGHRGLPDRNRTEGDVVTRRASRGAAAVTRRPWRRASAAGDAAGADSVAGSARPRRRRAPLPSPTAAAHRRPAVGRLRLAVTRPATRCPGPAHHPRRTRAHAGPRARLAPGDGGRVVVGDAALADEGRLIAGELGLAYAGRAGARAPGTSSWRSDPGRASGPESYTLTVKGGRVTDHRARRGGRLLRHPHPQAGGARRRHGARGRRARPARPSRSAGSCWTSRASTSRRAGSRTGSGRLGDLKFNQLGPALLRRPGLPYRVRHPPRDRVASSTSPRPRSGGSSRSRRAGTSPSCPRSTRPGHLGAVLARAPRPPAAQRAGRRRARGASTSPSPASARDRRRPAERVRRPVPRRATGTSAATSTRR